MGFLAPWRIFTSLALASLPSAAPGQDTGGRSFEARFAALAKERGLIQVARDPRGASDSAARRAPAPARGEGDELPVLLEPGRALAVVRGHLPELRACLEKELEKAPGFRGKLILELAVKRSGRVAELAIAPSEMQRSTLGECLMSEIPRWRFPEFSGERSDGVTQEVINTSIPLAFGS